MPDGLLCFVATLRSTPLYISAVGMKTLCSEARRSGPHGPRGFISLLRARLASRRHNFSLVASDYALLVTAGLPRGIGLALFLPLDGRYFVLTPDQCDPCLSVVSIFDLRRVPVGAEPLASGAEGFVRRRHFCSGGEATPQNELVRQETPSGKFKSGNSQKAKERCSCSHRNTN